MQILHTQIHKYLKYISKFSNPSSGRWRVCALELKAFSVSSESCRTVFADALRAFSTVFAFLRQLSALFLHPKHGFDPQAKVWSVARPGSA